MFTSKYAHLQTQYIQFWQTCKQNGFAFALAFAVVKSANAFANAKICNCICTCRIFDTEFATYAEPPKN